MCAAQGILSVTPGRTIGSLAGNGKAGLSGDGGAASAAQLARPSGMAFDASGNLFLADANNQVIRKITPDGVVSTVVGTGVAGFGGDNGPATSAFLDTPTGVALDATGNLYIADSHNHRIRKVSQGTITTVAGTGTAGFAGDGGPASKAQLALPTAVALDAAGNLYIADTNNHRIRKLGNGVLSTVAGNGEELYAGDGGPAIAASLDLPTGVAVDSAGTLYIADKNNQRVRVVNAGGTISTVAGSGPVSFSGAFGGDGAMATNAGMAKPVSVSIDAAGNIYVADTNNQRIRQIDRNGTISTVTGTGEQGFTGDGAAATTAVLNSPRAVLTDATGSLEVADTRNQRVRSVGLGQLVFASQVTGAVSAPQVLTISNTGTAPLTVNALAFQGPFAAVAGASCAAVPITLAPGTSCTENVVFEPTSAGQASGSVTIGGQGVVSQTVLLTGSASSGATTLLLAANKGSLLLGESVTFTATISSGNGAATGAGGSVSFYDGAQLLGTVDVVGGKATVTTSTLLAGSQAISANYSGSTGFGGSTSAVLAENVADLNLALNAQQALTVVPGHSVVAPLSLNAINATGLSGNVVLTTSPLPSGLSVAFAPATMQLSSGQIPFTMTVTAAQSGPETSAAAVPLAGAVMLLWLVVPVSRRRTLAGLRYFRPLALLLLSVGGIAALASLTGCGANTGFFGQKQQTYNIVVTATATDASGGTLTRNTTVAVTVQ